MTTTAQTMGVLVKLVDLINRWRKYESARGWRPMLVMHRHYSNIAILIPKIVKFSPKLFRGEMSVVKWVQLERFCSASV